MVGLVKKIWDDILRNLTGDLGFEQASFDYRKTTEGGSEWVFQDWLIGHFRQIKGRLLMKKSRGIAEASGIKWKNDFISLSSLCSTPAFLANY